MKFNEHFELAGRHAFLSASKYNWTNYTLEKLETVYRNHKAKEKGTELHEFASSAIKNRIKLANHKKTINMFVNDAIGFNMESEVVLCYSLNCFGTADAISFKDNMLRIHDLKTGFHRASFKQLDVYVALFCVEYGVSPHEIEIEQRIYQSNTVITQHPNPTDIEFIINKIVQFDRHIDLIKDTM